MVFFCIVFISWVLYKVFMSILSMEEYCWFQSFNRNRLHFSSRWWNIFFLYNFVWPWLWSFFCSVSSQPYVCCCFQLFEYEGFRVEWSCPSERKVTISSCISLQNFNVIFGLVGIFLINNWLRRRCPWCNGYRRRKWTRWHEFKSWTRLIAFHIALIPLGKVWIQLFSLQIWVNSRTDWVLQPWWGN